MAETGKTKMKAVHTVRLVKTEAKAGQRPEFVDIRPGTIFMCPNDQVEPLTRAGAITKPQETTPLEAAETTEPTAEPVDPEETRRQELLARARSMSIKGVRENSKIETLEEKIAEAEKAEAEKAEADEGDASEAVL